MAVVVGLIVLFFFKKKDRPVDYNQQYAKYIDAYTSGTISKKSFIRIQLTSQVKTMGDIGVADTRRWYALRPWVFLSSRRCIG